MLSVKIAYNNSCKEKTTFLQFSINPIFEFFNEDNPKELKGAWKYKGDAGAREVPFFGVYQDGKLIKGFYNEDKSSTVDNLLSWLDSYILEHSKKGWMTITKVEGSEEHFKLGDVHSGYTNAFCEGVGLLIKYPTGWYNTSIIKSIDWENKTFKTLNSTYAFTLEEKEKEQESESQDKQSDQ